MTKRELSIIKAILTYLHTLEGGQAEELTIHKEIAPALAPAPSIMELHAAMQHCDSQGWVTGVPARLTRKMKWAINDAGEGALLEM